MPRLCVCVRACVWSGRKRVQGASHDATAAGMESGVTWSKMKVGTRKSSKELGGSVKGRMHLVRVALLGLGALTETVLEPPGHVAHVLHAASALSAAPECLCCPVVPAHLGAWVAA